MSIWNRFKKSHTSSSENKKAETISEKIVVNEMLKTDYPTAIHQIQQVFEDEADFAIRELVVFGNINATIMYFSSLVDKKDISEDIIKPLLINTISNHEISLKEVVIRQTLYHADVQQAVQLADIVNGLLRGNTILIIEGIPEVILINTKKLEKRSIAQPETEQVIRGPRDGFIESLETNISLLRDRIPVPEFKVKSKQIGRITKSTVCIFYMENITNPSLVEDVEKRLERIDIDRVLDSGYLEQFIQDNPRSPFPQVKNTERPDVAVGNLLEGRVVIMVDGSPIALIVPGTFIMFYQSSEDYNERTNVMSVIRMTRIFSIIFSLVTPSTYVAIISYHPELIPTAFSVAITSGRAGVPFPAVIEVFLMEAAMEILREATVRMPKQVGGALSIVGVLVVGQAAVMAGFVSPITVVVIAITTIGSFATPTYSMANGFRMLRFFLIFTTGVLGLYGLILGLILIMNHLLSLRSFGVPYLSPISPMNWGGLRDSFIRVPLRWLIDRPEELFVKNSQRINNPKEYPTTNPLGPERHTDMKEEDQ
ncbi:spore germination protein KA [Ureibacillus xyleni]|uniref:Spore germination protein KA n=1 Tax=Ureibacillus xyleni TaxID=614648 RepID=A0A285T3F2_9BACL|nr:spore germination protein [Ureibacillus xyleni]SOC15850.1 spore germination protein KA [Ureibacillus xyleni]